jgi:hypothetical protein
MFIYFIEKQPLMKERMKLTKSTASILHPGNETRNSVLAGKENNNRFRIPDFSRLG